MTQKFYFKVRYQSEDKMHQLYAYAHGPFDDMDQVRKDIARSYPDKGDRYLVTDGELIGPPVNPKELPEAQKRAPGNEANWVKVDDLVGSGAYKWVCKTCNANILGAKVAHPIHVGGTGAGFGECKYEEVGYCPNCEQKPDFHGTPIQV